MPHPDPLHLTALTEATDRLRRQTEAHAVANAEARS